MCDIAICQSGAYLEIIHASVDVAKHQTVNKKVVINRTVIEAV